ncbi:MAG: hypothetical protein ACOX50_01790 [Patescibacteria group bacterium]|jgi:hypothetical protein
MSERFRKLEEELTQADQRRKDPVAKARLEEIDLTLSRYEKATGINPLGVLTEEEKITLDLSSKQVVGLKVTRAWLRYRLGITDSTARGDELTQVSIQHPTDFEELANNGILGEIRDSIINPIKA